MVFNQSKNLDMDKQKNSDSGYDRGISLMDSNTGSRHIKDYAEDKDKFVQEIYQLRKKYQ